MHNGRSAFVVFLFADPHLLESGQRGQNRAADPNGIFAFRRSDDLDLHAARGQMRDFFLHTIGDAREHGRTTRQHGIGVQVFTDIQIAFHDGIVQSLVHAGRFHTDEGRLEQDFGATETLGADGDHLTVGQLVALLQLELLVAVANSCSKSKATKLNFSLMSRTISRSAVVVKE